MDNSKKPSSDSYADFGTQFVPKGLVTTTYGKSSLQVYPTLTAGMSLGEKAYGFLTSKPAVENSDLPIRTKLQAFSSLTSTNPLVSAISARFLSFA